MLILSIFQNTALSSPVLDYLNPTSSNNNPEVIISLMDPDLTCTLNILSSISDESTTEFAFIDVYELAGNSTNGEITVTLPKDPRFTFAYDSSLSFLGIYEVNNANWSYDNSDPAFHVWKTSTVINGSGKSSIGIIFSYDPQGLDGEVSYTATVLANSGGETNSSNNSDSESITFFTN